MVWTSGWVPVSSRNALSPYSLEMSVSACQIAHYCNPHKHYMKFLYYKICGSHSNVVFDYSSGTLHHDN